MEKIVKNSELDFELNNGETVKVTLTFGRLALLRNVDASLYNKYNRIQYGKSEDMLDLVTLVYVAYWCANYGKVENLYSEKEFTELVPFNLRTIKRTLNELQAPKKK